MPRLRILFIATLMIIVSFAAAKSTTDRRAILKSHDHDHTSHARCRADRPPLPYGPATTTAYKRDGFRDIPERFSSPAYEGDDSLYRHLGRHAAGHQQALDAVNQRRFTGQDAFSIGTSIVPAFTRTASGCRNALGSACDVCCNQRCCEDVSDVSSRGLAAVSATAEVWLPLRIVLIRGSSSAFLSDGDVHAQLAVLNRAFAGTRFRFLLHSLVTLDNPTMANNCNTDPCYADPSTCYFFTTTLPAIVAGRTAATSVVPVVVCSPLTYLGEAQLPWIVAEASPLQYVQIGYQAWLAKVPAQPYGGGMTLVHEMGHYLGLLHTFEVSGQCDTDGDYVADTVRTKNAATLYEQCGTARNSCGDGLDDLSNYMNYAADGCMRHFSTGQVLRMEQAVLKYRPQLLLNSLAEGHCASAADGTSFAVSACTCTDSAADPMTLCGTHSAATSPFAAAAGDGDGGGAFPVALVAGAGGGGLVVVAAAVVAVVLCWRRCPREKTPMCDGETDGHGSATELSTVAVGASRDGRSNTTATHSPTTAVGPPADEAAPNRRCPPPLSPPAPPAQPMPSNAPSQSPHLDTADVTFSVSSASTPTSMPADV